MRAFPFLICDKKYVICDLENSCGYAVGEGEPRLTWCQSGFGFGVVPPCECARTGREALYAFILCVCLCDFSCFPHGPW